ncbi:uncharacterized protein [Nicotiana sylvestris]|uniref:uncharacterized protein n=1 Tax=Nicotiana sylvestris TaxID=4096 RepID=UPI00388CC0F0
MHANYSSMSKKLHKIQCCLFRMSRGPPPTDMQDSTVEYASDSAPTVFIGEMDSALVDENSNSIDTSEVLTELVNPSGNSSNSIQFCTVVSSLGCLGTSSTQLDTIYDAEEYSKVYACKVFTEIPVREIDMEVEDSVEYDLLNPESQVFDEMFHTVSAIKCDSSDLVRPNEILLALPYMFSACSHDQLIGRDPVASEAE